MWRGFRLGMVAAAALTLGMADARAFSLAHEITVVGSPAGPFHLTKEGALEVHDPVTGSWALSERFVSETPGFEFSLDGWSTSFDIDPFVTNNIVVTNTSSSIQTFVATVLLAIPAYSYGTVVNSSVGLSVTDSNGNSSLLLENSGTTPIFIGSVNGGTVLALNPSSPGTLPITTADCLGGPFAGCTAVSSANLPFLSVAPGVATQIGITLTFRLSPNDAATLTSRFEIVPEPGTLTLGLAGILGLAAVARSKRA